MKRTMRSGLSTTSGLGLTSLSRDELDSIHYATLQILRETGIKVMNERALEVFDAGGASVERFENHGIVKLPPYLVEECAYWAPHTFAYHARDPVHDFIMEPNRIGFTTYGGCINVIDPYTRELRRANKRDCGNLARVCDYLNEIHVTQRSVNSTEAAAGTQSVHNLHTLLSNSGKHVFLGADSTRSLEVMIELGAASVGGMDNFKRNPAFSVSVCPISPLTLGDNTCNIIMECARLGIGILIIPMALSGGTSSASLAGTLVTHNAEVLSSIVLAQLVSKGLPCTYATTSAILDLRFGTSAIGSPEYSLINASIAKIAQYYRLPCWAAGGASDSKVPDNQSSYEFTLSATLGALSGGNIVWGAGVLEQGLTMDYAKLMMDAEMIRMIQFVLEGIAVNDETLTMDVIHQVGPGGSYMANEHTYHSMRNQSQTKLFDRRSRERWMSVTKGESLVDRAYQNAIDILETHEPYPLPESAVETMQEIVEEFEKELGSSK